jgi:hypothetical protein
VHVPLTVTEITRRSIFDSLVASRIDWAGRLADEDFLSRLYDLTQLPSEDSRFSDASGDIWMHRSNFRDWSDDWVFYDHRFDLLRGRDKDFLLFLCETVHPIVRPNIKEAHRLVEMYNELLRADGWMLVENDQISGHPLFKAIRCDGRVEVFEEPTGWVKVDRQLQEAKLRLETARTEEQCQAVGLLCREVLISVAQEAFDATRHNAVNEVLPSKTDARRMLEAFFETELHGGSNEEARAHAKAALRLALSLQHDRSADFKTAALCCEATVSVVNIVAILCGRRG